MSDKVQVRAIRPFDNGDRLVDEHSDPFEVTSVRAAELKANGLVENAGGAKRAEEPANKQAAEPANKQAVELVNKADRQTRGRAD